MYWFKTFLDGWYVYVGLYPHTAIIGMSLLVWFGLPLDVAAKVWGPLMGATSSWLIYIILRELKMEDVAIYGAVTYACLGSHIYRSCSLSTTLEATAITLSLLFLCLWHKGVKISYFLLPLIAYSHYIVFFATCVYLFGWWWANTEASMVKRFLVFFSLGVGFIILIKFLPIGYALYQLMRTISEFNLNKVVYLYSSEDYLAIFKTLIITVSLFGITLLYGKLKYIRYVALFYGLSMLLSILFYSPIVSPYRLVVHTGMIGVVGYSTIIQKINDRKRLMITIIICLISLGQVYTYGLNYHIHFDDAITREEIDMINWLHVYNPLVDYNQVLCDDVGLENMVVLLHSDKTVDPYSTREKDYGLWYKKAEAKRLIIDNNTLDPTPPHIFYVFYSNRFSERALIRLPETENNKLRYRNYPIKDIWGNHPEWVLIYDGPGGKIYERASF